MGPFKTPALFLVVISFVTLLLGSCAGTMAPQSSPTSTDPPSASPASSPGDNQWLFGMHIHHIGSGTPWPAVSALPAWRLWDAGVSWREIEPSRGVFNFALLDSYVAIAGQHNTQVLLALAYTPQWASLRPNEPSGGGPGASAPPADLHDWDDFVTALITRYKGQIKAYEVLNEPNLPAYFTGTVTDQFNMLHDAYQIIKQTDPSATVLGPGYQGPGYQQLDQLLAMGGGAYMDVVAYHFYNIGNPEAIQPLIDLVKGVMTEHNFDRPIWDTEIGYGPWQNFTDQNQMAAYFARTILLHWRDHIDRAYWYAWDNHGWAHLWMTETDSVTLTKAGVAFSVLEGWLSGASLISCTTDSSTLNICTASLPDGSSEEIVWMTNGESSLAVQPAWHATSVEDLAGNHSALGTSLTVTESPVLLH